MCLIAINCDRRMASFEMEKAWKKNYHGAGLIWIDNNRKVNYVKGINSFVELETLVAQVELPYVIHFRYASVGGIDPLLTQPFEVSRTSPLKLRGSCNRVLVHNGTDHDWKKCLAAAGLSIPKDKDNKDEPISDSRAFAMILSTPPHKNNTNFLNSVNGRFVSIGYLHNEDQHAFRYHGDWKEDNGILYSNDDWRWPGSDYYNGKYYYNGVWYDKDVRLTHDTHTNTTQGDQSYKKKEPRTYSLDDLYPLPDDEKTNVLFIRKPTQLYSRAEMSRYRGWWIRQAYAHKLSSMIPPNNIDLSELLPEKTTESHTISKKIQQEIACGEEWGELGIGCGM